MKVCRFIWGGTPMNWCDVTFRIPDVHSQQIPDPAVCTPPWLHWSPSSRCRPNPNACGRPPPWAPPLDPLRATCRQPDAPGNKNYDYSPLNAEARALRRCYSIVHTVYSVPVFGTLQRTEASWLCLNVHGWTSWKKQSRMDRSVPVHCTLFMWMGPLPAQVRYFVFPQFALCGPNNHIITLKSEIPLFNTAWGKNWCWLISWISIWTTSTMLAW